LSSIIPQIIKIIQGFLTKRKDKNTLEILTETGGMPSSHSSFAAGITTMIFLIEGPTLLFFFAIMVTFIIIRDATGVRYAVGEQAIAINNLIEYKNKYEHKSKDDSKNKKNNNVKTDLKIETLKKLKIVKGHTIPQVIVGTAIGMIIAIIINLL
jgi:acid phosphatase family membrane protein YuiD